MWRAITVDGHMTNLPQPITWLINLLLYIPWAVVIKCASVLRDAKKLIHPGTRERAWTISARFSFIIFLIGRTKKKDSIDLR